MNYQIKLINDKKNFQTIELIPISEDHGLKLEINKIINNNQFLIFNIKNYNVLNNYQKKFIINYLHESLINTQKLIIGDLYE